MPAYFDAQSDGLFCREDRRGAAGLLAAESHTLAMRIFRAPISAFATEDWPRNRGADLRRFALQSLERHVERKLKTMAALARLR